MLVTIKTNGDTFYGWWNKKIYIDKVYLSAPTDGNITKNGTLIEDRSIMFSIESLTALIIGEETEKVVDKPKGIARVTRKRTAKEKPFKLPSWARILWLESDAALIAQNGGNHMALTVPRSVFGDMPDGEYPIPDNKSLKYYNNILSKISITGTSEIKCPDSTDMLGINYIFDGKIIGSCRLSRAKSVLPFASTDEIKPAFNGVYFDGAYVASDSRRLAYLDLDKSGTETFENVGFIMPYEFVKNAEDETIEFIETKRGLYARSGNLYSKIIEGQFPNYKQVIAGSTKDFTPIEILPTISDALLLTKKPSFKACIAADGMSYCGTDNTPYQFTSGAPGFDIGFNVQYVMDAVKASGSSTLLVSSPSNPMQINGIDADHPSAIIMPIAVKKGE